MPAYAKKLKLITFVLGGTSFECQVKTWQVVNNTEDGERQYTYCPDGEFREQADPDYALELEFFADWRSAGINDFLVTNDGLDATFVLDHHPDDPLSHVQWSGTVKVKAPSVGGEVRSTETTEITLPVYGRPAYTRIGA